MIKTTFKAHPLIVLSIIRPYLFVLIFPLLSAIFQYLKRGHIDGILLSELIIIGYLTLFAIFGWRAATITVDNRYITMRRGVILKNEAAVLILNVSSLTVIRNPLDLIFGSAEVIINTEAAGHKKCDFRVKLNKNDARLLIKYIYGQSDMASFGFSPWQIAVLSAASSSALGGFAIGVVIINKLSKISGVGATDVVLERLNEVSQNFIAAFPPVVNLITVFLLISYGISFVAAFFKNINFKFSYNRDLIELTSGIIVQKTTIFKKSMLKSVNLEQSPIMRVFGLCSAVGSIASFENQFKKVILIPAASKKQTKRLLSELFDHTTTKHEGVSPSRTIKTIKRFLFVPGMLVLGVVLSSVLMFMIFPKLKSLILIAAAFLLAIDLYYAFLCYQSYKNTKLCFENRVLMVGLSFFTNKKLYFYKDDVAVLKTTQTPIDLKRNTCKVKISVFGRCSNVLCVKHIDVDAVKRQIKTQFNLKKLE